MLQKGQKSLGNVSKNKEAGRWHLPPPAPNINTWPPPGLTNTITQQHHTLHELPQIHSSGYHLSPGTAGPGEGQGGGTKLASTTTLLCTPPQHTHNEDHLSPGATRPLSQRTRSIQSLLTLSYCPYPLLCFCGDRGMLQS